MTIVYRFSPPSIHEDIREQIGQQIEKELCSVDEADLKGCRCQNSDNKHGEGNLYD